MEPLNEKTWEPRGIQEVFTISPGKRLEARNRHPGKRPFIGALDNSNGVVQFVSDTNPSLDRNVLGVNYNGNGMGIGFYHPYECVFSDDVKRFHLRDTEDSEQLALFAKALIEKQRGKFGYLYKFNAKRMAATCIMLPVDDSGEPDYAYMVSYVNEIVGGLLMRYKSYLSDRLTELEHVDVPALDEKEWREFRIQNLFDSFEGGKGKGLNHLEQVRTGGIDYIGATNRNNGVLCAVKVDDDTRRLVQRPNCIGFIRNGDGAAGYAIYRERPFISTSDVIFGYAPWVNRFTGLFFVAAQDLIKPKYSHGHKRSPERLKRDRVMLPANGDRDPDYAYMEQYAMNMMLAKYQQYLAYLDTRVGRVE